MKCTNCGSDYVDLDETWSRKGSLQRNNWVPFEGRVIREGYCVRWSGGDMTWDWSDKPGKHYQTEIKPNLTEEQASQLEKYAISLQP